MNNFFKPVFLSWVFIFILSINGWATPPSEIKLEYDKTSKTLHIKIEHVSNNIRRHYIRNIEVYKNSKLIQNFRFAAQTVPQEARQDVSVDLKDGDVVRVKAICSKAGIKEESLTFSPTPSK